MSAVQLFCACPSLLLVLCTLTLCMALCPCSGVAHCSAKQMLKPATNCLPSQLLAVQLRCSAQPWA